MPLETAQFINQLDAANPLGSDPIAAGDDHLRLIKATIKSTFPNITGAVNLTQAQINDGLQKAGGTMTGALVLSGNPSVALGAATKQYVDSSISTATGSLGTLSTQNANAVNITGGTILAAVLQALYPVGTIYTNATNATNPGSLFGFGTWVAFGAGRVPVGFDSGNANFNAAEKTGGAETVALTEAQMPKHWHRMVGPFGTTNVQGGEFGYGNFGGGTPDDTAFAYGTWSAGGDAASGSTVTGESNGNPHNNLQPYITVYMWKRTA